MYTRPVTLAELQAALPESTAVVHFNTGAWNEPTTAFVLTRDGASAHVLAAGGLARRSRSPTRARNAGEERHARPRRELSATRSRRRSRRRCRPGITRLVIVPSAPLNTLPFDVLELPDGRRDDRAVRAVVCAERVGVRGAASSRDRRRDAVPAERASAVTRRARVRRAGASAPVGRSAMGHAAAAARGSRRSARSRPVAPPRSLVRLGRDASEAALKRAALSDVADAALRVACRGGPGGASRDGAAARARRRRGRQSCAPRSSAR